MSAILAREYIYRKGIHSQPKKVEAKDAAAYQEAPAQTFLRQGNVYPLIVAETITRARSSYPINATVKNPAREVTDFNMRVVKRHSSKYIDVNEYRYVRYK